MALERFGCAPLSQIFLVKFNAVFDQHFPVFLLEGFLPMVFFLPGDILLDHINLRRTDRKRPITFLLRKGRHSDFLMHTGAGGFFEVPHHIGQPVRGTQAGEHMHVIRDPADGIGHAS